MDLLQEKIRKTKCPILVDFAVEPGYIPEHLQGDYPAFCRELLQGLKGLVPGVRFSFDQFALLGDQGLSTLAELLQEAKELGFYVLIDGPAVLSPWAADRTAAAFFGENSHYVCDGLILSPYIGSDAMKPFIPYAKEQGKDVFFAVRSANKSAAELEDLMTGSRLVHVAAADMVNRHGEGLFGRCGYSQFGVLTAATNANAVSGLRSKYNRLFLLVDGLDYPGGNGKNCSLGFDKFGYGCAMSVGPAVVGAWKAEEGTDGIDYVAKAQESVLRIKTNMNRYITIL